jgi:hypothetical protein
MTVVARLPEEADGTRGQGPVAGLLDFMDRDH